MKYFKLKMIIALSLALFASQAFAWHNNTHLAIAQAAGFDMWYHCAGPDIAKIKAGSIESYNHWFNNTAEVEITPQMVLNQAEQYNKNTMNDAEGHLPGAIISSLRAYEKDLRSDKYAMYNLVYCAHYISDLTMPLHNIAFDDFNKEHHDANDGIVDETILNKKKEIVRQMYAITLRNEYFEADLARHIARIVNVSRKLGYKLRAEKRDMTRQEAYVQLGHSASLLKAVLKRYEITAISEEKAVK